MKAIRYTGLILFLFSLGLFLSLFFASSYQLTEKAFGEVVKQEHQESLKGEMSDMFGKDYSLTIPFVNDVKSAVETVNDKARSEQQWDKVIYDDYAGALTRASTQGMIMENTTLLFILVFIVGAIGGLMFNIPQVVLAGPAGIKNNGIFHNALNNRGWIGILTGTLLISFYILLYFFPAYIMNWIILVDPAQKLSLIHI